MHVPSDNVDIVRSTVGVHTPHIKPRNDCIHIAFSARDFILLRGGVQHCVWRGCHPVYGNVIVDLSDQDILAERRVQEVLHLQVLPGPTLSMTTHPASENQIHLGKKHHLGDNTREFGAELVLGGLICGY